MFAVIKTGGKQYRVSPGDMLIVEKLDGAPGDEIRFDQVMMLGEGEQITVGAPLVDGVHAESAAVVTDTGAASPVHHVAVVEHAGPAVEDAAPKKARAPRKPKAAAAASDDGALVEPPTSEVAAGEPQTIETASPGPGAQAGTDTDKA